MKNQRTTLTLLTFALVIIALIVATAQLIRRVVPRAEMPIALDTSIPEGWSTYHSEGGGFTISHPSPWSLQEEITTAAEWLDTMSEEDIAAEANLAQYAEATRARVAGVSLTLTERAHPDDYIVFHVSAERKTSSLEEALDARQPFDAYPEIERHAVSLDGAHGYRTTYVDLSGEHEDHSRETWVLLEHGDLFYRLRGVMSFKDVADEYHHAIDDIIGTLRFVRE